MASLNDYLFVSGLLFAIGLGGVMIRRNIIVIFMSLELMLAAANITLVAFSRLHISANGLYPPPRRHDRRRGPLKAQFEII